jgi:ribosomal protein L29
MTEEKKMPASESFEKLMKESRDELMNLRMQLQSLMVKCGLRALKTYQAARNEPLRPIEVASLVKYELDNVIADLSEPNSIDSIIKQTRLEWEKLQETKQKKSQ